MTGEERRPSYPSCPASALCFGHEDWRNESEPPSPASSLYEWQSHRVLDSQADLLPFLPFLLPFLLFLFLLLLHLLLFSSFFFLLLFLLFKLSSDQEPGTVTKWGGKYCCYPLLGAICVLHPLGFHNSFPAHKLPSQHRSLLGYLVPESPSGYWEPL